MLLKQIKIQAGVTWEEVRQQAIAVASLQHENVVNVERFCINEEDATLSLLLPDYSLGKRAVCTLRRALFSDASGVPKIGWLQTIKLATDIANALCFVHTKLGVSFGALSPDSVLVVPDSAHASGLKAVLCEFGRLGEYSLTRLSDPQSDFVRVSAPEIVAKASLAECGNPGESAAKQEATKSSDIFDFGMLLYFMACRMAPFSETRSSWKDRSALESRVLNEARPNLSFLPVDCPPGIRTLLGQCWEGVTGRPTISEVIGIFASIDPSATALSPRSGENRVSLKEASEAHRHDSSSGTPSPMTTATTTAGVAPLTAANLAGSSATTSTTLPKSVSIDSIWELLNAPETSSVAAPRGQQSSPIPVRAPHQHRRGSDTDQGTPPQPQRGLLEDTRQNVKFKVTLPDGSKSAHILTPNDTIARLLRKLGHPDCELVYSHSKETFGEKMLQRARQVRSSHSILVAVCPLSELRDIKATVNTAGTDGGVGWERQERIEAGRLHLSATSKDILRAIYHRKRDFQPRENVLLLNGRAQGPESAPLRQASLFVTAASSQQPRPNPEQVELMTVLPSMVAPVIVHHSAPQVGGSSTSLKDTTTEMRFWRQATIAQVRQCISVELGIPLCRTVLLAQGWGMLAKLSLALADYLPEDAATPLHLTVSHTTEVLEVIAENGGSCLVELSRDSTTAAAVLERGAEYLGCDAEQFVVCSASGSLVPLETRMTPAHSPVVLLHEDACLRASIGGKDFAFSCSAGSIAIEVLMRSIDKELILVYRGCIHPDTTHTVVPDGTYQLEHRRQEELSTVAILGGSDGKPLLRMHVVRARATVGDIAAYTAVQLGIRIPQLLDDAGAVVPPETRFIALPTEVCFRT